MDLNDRRNEVEIKSSEIREIDIYLHEVCKSICKIIYKNKFGTGFLIKFYKGEKELLCLMTNEHVITKEMIESKETVNINYNYEKKWIQIKLDERGRYIKYDQNMDITIIEMKPDDKIKEKYFLIPNTKNIDYKNKDIYIVQFPKGENLSYSEGKIKDINEYELIYDASTKPGSSGSPILLKNTAEVIGIHKQGNIKFEENYGTLINSIVLLISSKKIVYKNGEYYIGQWLNGLRHGKGKEYYKNGNIKYEGDFCNGKFEGNGKYIWNDGEYYVGQFLNNLRHGKGKEYYKDGIIKYEGDYINDKREGNGKYIYINGSYYIGQWLKGLKHGHGKLYYKNGNIKYDGDYVNDKIEGSGKYIWEDGEYYIGQWLNGVRHGKGKLYYKDGNIKYEGDYVNDNMEGKGKYIYEDGDYYIGYFLNNLRNGKGKEYYKNGNIKYEGVFINDKGD